MVNVEDSETPAPSPVAAEVAPVIAAVSDDDAIKEVINDKGEDEFDNGSKAVVGEDMQAALAGVAARTGLPMPGDVKEDEIIAGPDALAPHSDEDEMLAVSGPSVVPAEEPSGPSVVPAVEEDAMSLGDTSGTVSPSLPSPISGLSPDHSPMVSPGDEPVVEEHASPLGSPSEPASPAGGATP